MAAVLACGRDAALSHRSAADKLGLRLIVEVDGRAVHTTRHAFEHDRRRDQRLMLRGWRVARFTWRQVVDEPAAVAVTIGALLAEPA
jgi:very-short-patch-repair endonuclease